MSINCLRCDKVLIKPNSSNAKYIINESDPRTFLDSKEDEFEVLDDGNSIGKFKKFHLAQKEKIKKDKPFKDVIKIKENDLKEFNKTLHQLIDNPKSVENTENITIESSKIQSTTNDIALEVEKINKIVIKISEVTKPKSKTAIICRDSECQDENDTIIWG